MRKNVHDGAHMIKFHEDVKSLCTTVLVGAKDLCTFLILVCYTGKRL